MEVTLLQQAICLNISANRRHRQLVDEKVRDIGFHRTAHMTLMALAISNKVISQKDLAAHFSITPAAITGILKGLERDGYITRESGQDGRVNEIFITERGREVIKMSREAFHEVDAAMFEGFTDDDLREYIRLATRMTDNMKRRRGEL